MDNTLLAVDGMDLFSCFEIKVLIIEWCKQVKEES